MPPHADGSPVCFLSLERCPDTFPAGHLSCHAKTPLTKQQTPDTKQQTTNSKPQTNSKTENHKTQRGRITVRNSKGGTHPSRNNKLQTADYKQFPWRGATRERMKMADHGTSRLLRLPMKEQRVIGMVSQ
jgi:hypothetical protein